MRTASRSGDAFLLLNVLTGSGCTGPVRLCSCSRGAGFEHLSGYRLSQHALLICSSALAAALKQNEHTPFCSPISYKGLAECFHRREIAKHVVRALTLSGVSAGLDFSFQTVYVVQASSICLLQTPVTTAAIAIPQIGSAVFAFNFTQSYLFSFLYFVLRF
jgi:hypothetical protein